MTLRILVTLQIVSCLSLYGQTPEQLCNQAIELSKKGQTEKAIEILKQAIEKDPGRKETYYVLGKAYLVNRDAENGEINFKRALEIDSTYVDPYDYLTLICYLRKDFEAGSRYFDKAIELESSVQRFLGRADLRGAAGDYQGAIDDCDRVIRIEPSNADVYVTRGNSRFGLKDKVGACADLGRAIELGKPKDAFYIKYCEQ